MVKRNGVHRHTTFEKKKERNGLNFGILEKKNINPEIKVFLWVEFEITHSFFCVIDK